MSMQHQNNWEESITTDITTRMHTITSNVILDHIITQQEQRLISVVDSIKVLRPFFDKIEILVPGDSRSIFPSLDKK